MRRTRQTMKYGCPFSYRFADILWGFNPVYNLNCRHHLTAFRRFDQLRDVQTTFDGNFKDSVNSMSDDYVLQSTRQEKHGDKVMS